MNFNVSIKNLIPMALDTKHGNLNQHFLVLLLQTIVQNSDLNQCHVEFDGDDAIRAKEVINGKLDPGVGPLNKTHFVKPTGLMKMNTIMVNHNFNKDQNKSKIHSHALPEKYVLQRLNPEALTNRMIKTSKRLYKLENIVTKMKDMEAALALDAFNKCTRHEFEGQESSIMQDEDEYTANAEFDEASKFSNAVDHWNDILAPKEFTTFQTTIGLMPKKRDMKEELTVGNFKVFFDAYEKKFAAIHKLLLLQADNINENKKNIVTNTMNKLNIKELDDYKVEISASLHSIRKDIKQYILRDPEALGIVTYVKDVNCLSCGTCSMMRTRQPLISKPPKIPLKPYPKDRLICSDIRKPSDKCNSLKPRFKI